MEIKNNWMTDYSYFGTDYPNNKLLDDGKYRFELQKQSLEGKDVFVDGSITSERIVVQNHTNPLNQEKYDKKLCFDITSNIHTGSIIEFDSKTYLVTSQIFNKQAYKVGSVLECTYNLNVYKNNTPYQIPCVIQSGIKTSQLGTDENTYIEMPSSTITMKLSNTEITRLITRGEIYQIGLQNWEIKDINDIIEPGLLVFKLEYSQVAQETHVYGITILNGSSISIQQGSTLQINVQATDNGEIVSSPTLSFTSSNELICSVNSSGLVSAVDGGSCVISVSFNGVSASIEITVIETVQHNITAEISGSSSIIKGKTSEYICIVRDNGIVVPGDMIFYLTGDDGVSNTNLATISSYDTDSCVITAGNSIGYVKLWAKNENESIITPAFRIQIKNLY